MDYKSYVGPRNRWDLLAGIQFSLLFQLGLREHHKVLDIGCGALRAGRLLIPYLNQGGYFGIEPNKELVLEGLIREVGSGLVSRRSPKFLHSENFPATQFGVTFDYVLIQSVFSHAPKPLIKVALKECFETMDDVSLLVATFKIGSVDYEGETWKYPGVASYTNEFIRQEFFNAGFSSKETNVYHPTQTWWVAAKTGARMAQAEYLLSEFCPLGGRLDG